MVAIRAEATAAAVAIDMTESKVQVTIEFEVEYPDGWDDAAICKLVSEAIAHEAKAEIAMKRVHSSATIIAKKQWVPQKQTATRSVRHVS